MSRDNWLKERSKGIGGSDAAAILGVSPYKTNERLWLEKTGQEQPEDISGKSWVIDGTKSEEHIRELFKLAHPNIEYWYEPFNNFASPKYDFIRGSVDGIITMPDGTKGIHEIKNAEIFGLAAKEKWNCTVPVHYLVQVLHYFNVFPDAKFAVLTALLKTKVQSDDFSMFDSSAELRNYVIMRTRFAQAAEDLLGKELKFWECVKSGTRPDLILPNL